MAEYATPSGLQRSRFPAMGTTIEVLLPAGGHHDDGGTVVRDLFTWWERTCSRFEPESELSWLNRQSGRPTVLSPLLCSVLGAALDAARATGGLYDPTLLPQLSHLGYDRSFETLNPTAQAVETMPGGDWRAIRLDRTARLVQLPEGVQLDFGGIAKGMAVDAALTRLQELGIRDAMVNAGGDLAVQGAPPGGSWPIAVSTLTGSTTMLLQKGAMATSGIARRHWLQGTLPRHHLLDPRTGSPVENGMWSASVVAPRCVQAEVAAKTAFILGPREGVRFLEERGLAGLLQCADGAVHHTGSWMPGGAA